MNPATNGQQHPRTPVTHRAVAPVSKKATLAEAEGEHELPLSSLRPFLVMFTTQLRARWWTGVLAALLIGGGLSWLLFRGPTESIAETTLLAQGPLDKILNLGEAQLAEQRQENILRNHISVMSSNSFRQRLTRAFSASEAAAIQAPYLEAGAEPSEENLMRLIAGKINLARERGRDLFIVRVHHYTADVAVLIANRFASEYVRFVQDEYHEQGRGGLALLEAQASALTEDIRRIETERRAYRKTLGFISLEENQGVIGDRLRRINGALSDVRIQRLSLENQLREAQSASTAATASFDNPVLAAFGSNQALRGELDRLGGQRAVLAAQYGPNHPKMVELENMATGLRRTLGDNFSLALAELQSRVSLAVSSEAKLGEELAEAFNQSLGIDEQAGRFNTLGEELTAKTKAQAALLQHIAQTEVALHMPTNSLRIIDTAYLVDAGFRKKLLFIAVLGLAGFVFLATPLVVHTLDGRLSASADIEHLLGTELLGAVPRVGGVPARDLPHLVRDNVQRAAVDSFLGIVDRIELLSPAGTSKVILITSTLPGEGKSMIASNLAAAFTRIGRRTVLVDCDFRRSAQHAIHGIPETKGLASWAAGDLPFTEDLLTPQGPLGISKLADGSFLLPAGGPDTQPTRYLIAPKFGLLFERLRQKFDVIIVDTPPAGVFQDALLLARFCTTTILVGRHGVARTQQVERALREFEHTAAPASGLVLNAFPPHAAHPSIAYRALSANYGYRRSDRAKNPGSSAKYGSSTG